MAAAFRGSAGRHPPLCPDSSSSAALLVSSRSSGQGDPHLHHLSRRPEGALARRHQRDQFAPGERPTPSSAPHLTPALAPPTIWMFALPPCFPRALHSNARCAFLWLQQSPWAPSTAQNFSLTGAPRVRPSLPCSTSPSTCSPERQATARLWSPRRRLLPPPAEPGPPAARPARQRHACRHNVRPTSPLVVNPWSTRSRPSPPAAQPPSI